MFVFHRGAKFTVPPRSKNKKVKKGRPAKRKAESGSARRQIHRPGALPDDLKSKHVGALFEEFVAVQARLRAPGGCPWDREQSHLTLRTYLIEEAYEVLDAIERASAPAMAEELGDLLLQVLFHADLAREAGSFDITDVIAGIRDKMIRRHPHVFGNVKAETPGEVLKNWAKLKAAEKQGTAGGQASEQKKAPSALEGVPRHLPALLEAYQLTRKAAQIGFDWHDVEGIIEKLREESAELRDSLRNPAGCATEEEVGDLLFTVVNIARFLKLDPEVTLEKANLKFKARFEDMESSALRSGVALSELSKEELEILWESAKSKPFIEAASSSES